MKDFQEFVNKIDPKALVQEANDYIKNHNDQYLHTKDEIPNSQVPNHCAVRIALNLIRDYHMWLHDEDEIG